jgi:hypothetical protein
MIAIFRRFVEVRKMKSLIKSSLELLYRDECDFSTASERLTRSKQPMDLIRAYLAMGSAARLVEPTNKKTPAKAVQHVCKALNNPASQDVLDNLVRNSKTIAEIDWMTRQIEIYKRKKAWKENEYSYPAMVYQLEKAGRGPLSNGEREKYKKIANSIAETEKKLGDHLSDEAFDNCLAEMIKQVEEEKRRAGTSPPGDATRI